MITGHVITEGHMVSTFTKSSSDVLKGPLASCSYKITLVPPTMNFDAAV